MDYRRNKHCNFTSDDRIEDFRVESNRIKNFRIELRIESKFFLGMKEIEIGKIIEKNMESIT